METEGKSRQKPEGKSRRKPEGKSRWKPVGKSRWKPEGKSRHEGFGERLTCSHSSSTRESPLSCSNAAPKAVPHNHRLRAAGQVG